MAFLIDFLKIKQIFYGKTSKMKGFMKDLKEKEILSLIERKTSVKVEEIAKSLFMSASTVRRKLNALEEKGLIKRLHGKAVISNANSLSPSFTFRSHQNVLEKKKMGLYALDLIKDGDVIFLDGSTSAFYIASALGKFKNITVITNGIDTLSQLSELGIKAYSTGGEISDNNKSVFVGSYAEEMIKNFHADIFFFSVASAYPNGEIYDCFIKENFIRKKMIENSTKSVLLLDSAKFNTQFPYRLCNINELDYVITETDVKEYFTCPLKTKFIPEK